MEQENEIIKIEKAEREAAPMIIGIAAPSGGGKTFSALRLAAGMVGEGGKVGMISTEPARGKMYADDPIIKKELPQGYDITEMSPPFTDTRLINHIKHYNRLGYGVLIIDSETHFYEGPGGMEEQAGKSKTGWLTPKMYHKKRIYVMNGGNMSLIFCVRAREKVKVTGKGKDQEYKQLGIQPVCEKNFMFEMTLSMLLDVETNTPKMLKCPSPLKPLFENQGAIITKVLGERLREWNESGKPIDKELRALQLDIREEAMLGSVRYNEFIAKLTPEQKEFLKVKCPKTFWTECKLLTEEADRVEKQSRQSSENENPFNSGN